LEAAQKAVELNPLLATAYYNLGVAQGAADHRAALDSFRMSAAVDPRRIDAKLNMAIAMAHLGSTDEAIEHLQKLVAEHPDFAEARQALMLLQQGPADKQGGEKR
jgi:tetratricopeptide (TPR) repeat protein